MLERDESNATVRTHTHGPAPVAGIGTELGYRVHGATPTVRWVQRDAIGSTWRETDESTPPTPTSAYEIGAWGGTTGLWTEPGTDFLFCGKEVQPDEPDADLIYFGRRYYAPRLGRWISRDPARQSLNWYTYCSNNPMKYVDAEGLRPITQQEAEMVEEALHLVGLPDAQRTAFVKAFPIDVRDLNDASGKYAETVAVAGGAIAAAAAIYADPALFGYQKTGSVAGPWEYAMAPLGGAAGVAAWWGLRARRQHAVGPVAIPQGDALHRAAVLVHEVAHKVPSTQGESRPYLLHNVWLQRYAMAAHEWRRAWLATMQTMPALGLDPGLDPRDPQAEAQLRQAVSQWTLKQVAKAEARFNQDLRAGGGVRSGTIYLNGIPMHGAMRFQDIVAWMYWMADQEGQWWPAGTERQAPEDWALNYRSYCAQNAGDLDNVLNAMREGLPEWQGIRR